MRIALWLTAALAGIVAPGCSWPLVPLAAQQVAPPAPETQLAYADGDGVVVRRLDGGGDVVRVPLADAMDARLSPDGSRVAAMGVGEGARGRLVVADASTGAVVLRRRVELTSSWAVWSPDGGRLALGADGGVMIVDVDTRDATVVGTEVGDVYGLTWAPDGAAVAVDTERGAFVVWLDGGPSAPLGAAATSQYARWGAQGIAYSDSGGLHLVASPGEPPRDLTSPSPRTVPGHAMWAPIDWSADGGRLLLALACGHCVESAVLDLASGQFVWQGAVVAMAISRDGRRVLVQDGCGGGAPTSVEVGYPGRVVDIDRGGVQAIPFRLLTCAPSWSPGSPP